MTKIKNKVKETYPGFFVLLCFFLFSYTFSTSDNNGYELVQSCIVIVRIGFD